MKDPKEKAKEYFSSAYNLIKDNPDIAEQDKRRSAIELSICFCNGIISVLKEGIQMNPEKGVHFIIRPKKMIDYEIEVLSHLKEM